MLSTLYYCGCGLIVVGAVATAVTIGAITCKVIGHVFDGGHDGR